MSATDNTRLILYRNGFYTLTHRREGVEPPPAPGRAGSRDYRHTSKQARLFVCRALKLVAHAKHAPSTMLLTFPGHVEGNPWIPASRFLNNLRMRYGLNAYCAALEVGEQGGLPHFHLIVDMPRYDPAKLKDAWNSARGSWSNNSVRDMRVLQDPLKAARYAAKYAAKIGKDQATKQHKWKKYAYHRSLVGDERMEVSAAVLRSFQVAWERDLEYCTIGYVKDQDRVGSLFFQQDLGFSVFFP